MQPGSIQKVHEFILLPTSLKISFGKNSPAPAPLNNPKAPETLKINNHFLLLLSREYSLERNPGWTTRSFGGEDPGGVGLAQAFAKARDSAIKMATLKGLHALFMTDFSG
jgi:hypothetical protein